MNILILVSLLLLGHVAYADNFQQRCAAPGVLVCQGFDVADTLSTLPVFKGDYESPRISTAQHASGPSALEMEIRGKTTPGTSGSVWVPIGKGFGERSEFYIQWRQRWNVAMVTIPWSSIIPGVIGWKQLAVHYHTGGCPLLSVVFERWYDNYPMAYARCGQYTYSLEKDGGTYYQQGDHLCKSGQPSTGSCWYYVPDTWVTFALHIKVGLWNQPNSVVEAWVGEAGKAWGKFIDKHDAVMIADSAEYVFDTIQLTSYMTGKDSQVDHATAFTWYDEVIVSEQPIAAPADNPGSTPMTARSDPVPVPGNATLVTALPIPSAPGWYELAHTKLRQVDPCPQRGCAYSGVEGQSAVVNDWCSGAFDTLKDRLLLWCGGHEGYGGNEIYAVNVSSLSVERITEPAVPKVNFDTDASGTQPAARHTYDGVVYMANVDQLLSVGGVYYGAPFSNGPTGHWRYDFATKQWRNDVRGLPVYTDASNSQLNFTQAEATYDAVTGHVWVMGYWCLYEYDPVVNTARERSCGVAGQAPGYYTSVIDPIRHYFYLFGYNTALRADIGSNGDARLKPFVQNGGDAVWKAPNAWPGLAFDPVTQHIVAWFGGSTVYDFDPDTGVWVTLVYPGGPAASLNGTYKRWAYSAKQDVFVVVTDVDKNMFAFVMPRGKKVPAAPMNLRRGQ